MTAINGIKPGFLIKPLLTKEGLGWLIIICYAVFFCAASAYGQSYDTCAHLKYWRYKSSYYTDTAFYTMQYDSLRYYIVRCLATDNNISDLGVFNDLDVAAQLMNNDTNRYDTYRAWLISVLYLNKTLPEYFCVVMGSIAGTYYGKYKAVGYLAVMNYLRSTRVCWDSLSQVEYTNDSAYDAGHGYDVNHLPPLDSLGLGFLIKSGVVPTTTGIGMSYLVSFTSSPNPFGKSTTLEFILNRMSYIQLAVYDELGRLVWGDGRGSSIEAGMHSVQIDGTKLPSGTLYARISTGFGEVKTVKLVHEK